MSAQLVAEVAEAILNDAQSGSAVWDELNGPSARLTKVSETKHVVSLPGWDDIRDDYDWTRPVTITVEWGGPS